MYRRFVCVFRTLRFVQCGLEFIFHSSVLDIVLWTECNYSFLAINTSPSSSTPLFANSQTLIKNLYGFNSRILCKQQQNVNWNVTRYTRTWVRESATWHPCPFMITLKQQIKELNFINKCRVCYKALQNVLLWIALSMYWGTCHLKLRIAVMLWRNVKYVYRKGLKIFNTTKYSKTTKRINIYQFNYRKKK
jgi:hypothetical protein